jgi:hypothetical protein
MDIMGDEFSENGLVLNSRYLGQCLLTVPPQSGEKLAQRHARWTTVQMRSPPRSAISRRSRHRLDEKGRRDSPTGLKSSAEQRLQRLVFGVDFFHTRLHAGMVMGFARSIESLRRIQEFGSGLLEGIGFVFERSWERGL